MRAIYTSVFDGSITCVSACRYDPDTKCVSDIEPAGNSDEAENADALTDEFVTLPNGTVLREEDGVAFDY